MWRSQVLPGYPHSSTGTYQWDKLGLWGWNIYPMDVPWACIGQVGQSQVDRGFGWQTWTWATKPYLYSNLAIGTKFWDKEECFLPSRHFLPQLVISRRMLLKVGYDWCSRGSLRPTDIHHNVRSKSTLNTEVVTFLRNVMQVRYEVQLMLGTAGFSLIDFSKNTIALCMGTKKCI